MKKNISKERNEEEKRSRKRKNDTDLTLQFRRLNCVHAVYISSGPRLTIAADRIDRDFSRCL